MQPRNVTTIVQDLHPKLKEYFEKLFENVTMELKEVHPAYQYEPLVHKWKAYSCMGVFFDYLIRREFWHLQGMEATDRRATSCENRFKEIVECLRQGASKVRKTEICDTEKENCDAARAKLKDGNGASAEGHDRGSDREQDERKSDSESSLLRSVAISDLKIGIGKGGTKKVEGDSTELESRQKGCDSNSVKEGTSTGANLKNGDDSGKTDDDKIVHAARKGCDEKSAEEVHKSSSKKSNPTEKICTTPSTPESTEDDSDDESDEELGIRIPEIVLEYYLKNWNFIRKCVTSYQSYKNPKNATLDIIEEVYYTSMFHLIYFCDPVRPFNSYLINFNNLKSVLKFVRTLNFQNIVINPDTDCDYFNGDGDFVIDDTLLDIKVSKYLFKFGDEMFKKVFYKMALYSLGLYISEGSQIKTFKVYNPLQGIMYLVETPHLDLSEFSNLVKEIAPL